MSKCECKNCIHNEVCKYEVVHSTKGCEHYKDKSLCVEVVRCKDCIHRYKPTRCALWYATVGNVEYFTDKGEDFYCERGETQEKAEIKLREVGE